MKEIFRSAAALLRDELRGGEGFALSFSGERSDFARFSKGRAHQIGSVAQTEAEIRLIRGRRHASLQLPLAGSPARDRERLRAGLARLRGVVEEVPEDPYLLRPEQSESGERIEADRLPPAEASVDAILRSHRGLDLVGIFASGTQAAGFADERGQENWHQVASHHLDWSVHGEAGRAVKATYADFSWDDDALLRRAEGAKRNLEALASPPRHLDPGNYRVFLSPAALDEILSLLSWGGFSARAQKTRTTPLLQLVEGQASLHPEIGISENIREGLAPDFDKLGFRRPPSVDLIDSGRHAGALVSPRSAAEFDLIPNGATAYEAPQSLDVAGGSLDLEDPAGALEDGIYISNLWYTNYSDRNACRTTGMTRFATLWVENGSPVAAVAPMRFDDTLFRILGENLEGVTRQREFLPSPDTYGSRSFTSARLPGVLVNEFTLTL